MTATLDGRPGTIAREGGAGARAVVALAALEARRLLTHPLFLVLAGLGVLLWRGADEDFYRYRLLVGGGLGPLALGTFLAANLGTSRSRRHYTDELYESLPVPASGRTAAHLLSVGGAVAAALAALAAMALSFRLWEGLPVAAEERLTLGRSSVSPALVELAQGPLVVALAGCLGVALALWVRSTLVPMTMAVVASQSLLVGVLWWRMGGAWWLVPLTHDLRLSGSTVTGFEGAAMGWHLVYLVGLTLLVGAAAMLRHGATRRRAAGAVAGMVAGGAGGVLQLVVAGGRP